MSGGIVCGSAGDPGDSDGLRGGLWWLYVGDDDRLIFTGEGKAVGTFGVGVR